MQLMDEVFGWSAAGPGCPDLPDPGHGRITYHIDDDEALHANASCDEGFRFTGYDDLSVKQIRCTGFLWNGFIPECERKSNHVYMYFSFSSDG